MQWPALDTFAEFDSNRASPPRPARQACRPRQPGRTRASAAQREQVTLPIWRNFARQS